MLVCLRVVFQEEHMTTTLTIIRVFKWLSALGLLLTVAIGAAMIDRRFTMLLLPPFFMHTHAVSKTRPMWPAVAAQPADWPRVAGAWGSLGRSSTRACGKQPPSGFGHFALQRTSRQRYPGGLQPRPALASLGQLAGMFELAGHADFALLLGTGARAIPSARSRSSSCSSCPSRTSASACRGYSWPAQAWGARRFWTGSWPPPLRRPPSNA